MQRWLPWIKEAGLLLEGWGFMERTTPGLMLWIANSDDCSLMAPSPPFSEERNPTVSKIHYRTDLGYRGTFVRLCHNVEYVIDSLTHARDLKYPCNRKESCRGDPPNFPSDWRLSHNHVLTSFHQSIPSISVQTSWSPEFPGLFSNHLFHRFIISLHRNICMDRTLVQTENVTLVTVGVWAHKPLIIFPFPFRGETWFWQCCILQRIICKVILNSETESITWQLYAKC